MTSLPSFSNADVILFAICLGLLSLAVIVDDVERIENDKRIVELESDIEQLKESQILLTEIIEIHNNRTNLIVKAITGKSS